MVVGQQGWQRVVQWVRQGRRIWRWAIVGLLTLALVVSLHPWSPSGGVMAQVPPEMQEEPISPDPGFVPNYPTGLPFEEQIAGLDRQDGVFTIYSNVQENKVFLAVRPNQLHRNYMIQATLESGVGEMGLFRGWPIYDFVFQFRPGRNNLLQVVVPNLNVRTPNATPSQRRLQRGSFSDSVILAAEVISTDPATGTQLIDLNALLLGQDLADIYGSLGGALGDYEPNFLLSGITDLKAFPENLEVGADLILNQSGGLSLFFSQRLQSLPDSRGFSLHLRFSLSQLPGNNGYRPRLADERVGYFISTFRAPFQVGRGDRFVRYINRWHLEKANPQAPRSRPRQPLVFWVENTVPVEYRAAVREGILAWNAAFEQAGFEQAIEVRQMPDNADWDPADVRYNVVRWSDSLNPWALGLGPSRANPLTGQILDADVILDANTIDYLQGEFQQQGLDSAGEAAFYLQSCGQRSQAWYGQWLAIQSQRLAQRTGQPPRLGQPNRPVGRSAASGAGRSLRPTTPQTVPPMADHFCAAYAARDRATFGALALTTLAGANYDPNQLQEYIRQFIVHLTTHEVGHVLGLRHNFAGSLLLDPQELGDPAAIATRGLASSAMDYIPPNVAAPGQAQTTFFPTTVGPYDRWAIEYGYRDFGRSRGGQEEAAGLTELLRQSSTQPELAYVPDEDTWDWIDPEVSPWDLSTDPITYATQQLGNAQGVWQRLNRWSLLPGEGFGGLRRRVDLVFSQFRASSYTIANYIGGQRFRRVSPWDEQRRVPFAPIPPEKQRQALRTLAQQVFAPDAFQFSPELLNQLAPNRWWHWGTNLTVYPLDYPIYEQVLMTQGMMLAEVMYSERLQRLRDGEFRDRDPQRVTLEEVYDTLHGSIWSELRTTEGSTRINSLRRGLQRYHLDVLTNQVLRRSLEDASNASTFMEFMAILITVEAPEDARLLARSELRQLGEEVQQVLRQGDRVDRLTRAHLEAVRDRIAQTLNASLRTL